MNRFLKLWGMCVAGVLLASCCFPNQPCPPTTVTPDAVPTTPAPGPTSVPIPRPTPIPLPIFDPGNNKSSAGKPPKSNQPCKTLSRITPAGSAKSDWYWRFIFKFDPNQNQTTNTNNSQGEYQGCLELRDSFYKTTVFSEFRPCKLTKDSIGGVAFNKSAEGNIANGILALVINCTKTYDFQLATYIEKAYVKLGDEEKKKFIDKISNAYSQSYNCASASLAGKEFLEIITGPITLPTVSPYFPKDINPIPSPNSSIPLTELNFKDLAISTVVAPKEVSSSERITFQQGFKGSVICDLNVGQLISDYLVSVKATSKIDITKPITQEYFSAGIIYNGDVTTTPSSTSYLTITIEPDTKECANPNAKACKPSTIAIENDNSKLDFSISLNGSDPYKSVPFTAEKRQQGWWMGVGTLENSSNLALVRFQRDIVTGRNSQGGLSEYNEHKTESREKEYKAPPFNMWLGATTIKIEKSSDLDGDLGEIIIDPNGGNLPP